MRYKVGDRVKHIDENVAFLYNKVGTVIKVNHEEKLPFEVRFDDMEHIFPCGRHELIIVGRAK